MAKNMSKKVLTISVVSLFNYVPDDKTLLSNAREDETFSVDLSTQCLRNTFTSQLTDSLCYSLLILITIFFRSSKTNIYILHFIKHRVIALAYVCSVAPLFHRFEHDSTVFAKLREEIKQFDASLTNISSESPWNWFKECFVPTLFVLLNY